MASTHLSLRMMGLSTPRQRSESNRVAAGGLAVGEWGAGAEGVSKFTWRGWRCGAYSSRGARTTRAGKGVDSEFFLVQCFTKLRSETINKNKRAHARCHVSPRGGNLLSC
jgi:hypothetical protein